MIQRASWAVLEEHLTICTKEFTWSMSQNPCFENQNLPNVSFCSFPGFNCFESHIFNVVSEFCSPVCIVTTISFWISVLCLLHYIVIFNIFLSLVKTEKKTVQFSEDVQVETIEPEPEPVYIDEVRLHISHSIRHCISYTYPLQLQSTWNCIVKWMIHYSLFPFKDVRCSRWRTVLELVVAALIQVSCSLVCNVFAMFCRRKWTSCFRWSRVQIQQMTSQTPVNSCSWRVSLKPYPYFGSVLKRLIHWFIVVPLPPISCLQPDGSSHWSEVGGHW